MQPKGVTINHSGLNTVLADLDLTCLDVGARGGFTKDLLPIAGSVSAVGFEPDAAECERLNREASKGSHPWRSLRFLPVALGAKQGSEQLHLYRQRGCSSMLEADRDLAALFSREDYYILDDVVEVPVTTLDVTAREHGLEDTVFLKLDVQGGELDILSASSSLLSSSLLGLRLEVSFIPIYRNQPLFADIDKFLGAHGFVSMGFMEMHHWRRTTKVKHPNLVPGPLPYSRGQLVHGDMLYFRHPEAMRHDTPEQIEVLLKAAFIAIAYDYFDHAAAILGRPTVVEYIRDRHGIDPYAAVCEYSQLRARAVSPSRFLSLVHMARRALARLQPRSR